MDMIIQPMMLIVIKVYQKEIEKIKKTKKK